MKPDDKDLNFHSGHRERLRQKFLDDKLADYELLELLLSYVIPRRDVRPLARELMGRFGGVYPVITAPLEKLMEIRGLGRNTAIFIKAIHKIMIAGYKCNLDKETIFHNNKILTNYCLLMMAGKSKEEMHILYVDGNMRLLADDLHSLGTVDWAAVYPREILKRALDLNARFIIMVHNHPTPNTMFSTQDIDLTDRVQDLLATVGIEVIDHYVVSGGVVYSARNMFLIKQIPHVANNF